MGLKGKGGVILVTTEQKLLAILSHMAWMFGGVGLVVVPFIVYLIKKDDPFVARHAKQALVAQLTVFALSAFVGLMMMLLIGFLLLPAMAVIWIGFFICNVIAVLRAADGRDYDYPFIQPLVLRI